MYSNDLVTKLQFANKIGITSAPLVIKHIKVNSQESIIITEYPNCTGDIVPILDFEEKINTETKEKLLQDAKTLASNNLANLWVAKGLAHWEICLENNKVFWSGWESLQRVDDSTANDIFEKIKTKIEQL